MSGYAGLLKIGLGGLVLLAAANGTEVVDVVEVIGDVTVNAQAMVEEVKIEPQEVVLDPTDPNDAGVNPVFARRGSEGYSLAFRSESTFERFLLTELLAQQNNVVDPGLTLAPTETPSTSGVPTTTRSRVPAPTTAAPTTTTTAAPTTTTTTTAAPTTTTTTTAAPTTTTTAAPTTTTTAAPTTAAPTTTTTTTAAPTTTTTTTAPTTTTIP